MLTTEVSYIFVGENKRSVQEKIARSSDFPEVIIGSTDDLILDPSAIMLMTTILFSAGSVVGFLIALLTSNLF